MCNLPKIDNATVITAPFDSGLPVDEFYLFICMNTANHMEYRLFYLDGDKNYSVFTNDDEIARRYKSLQDFVDKNITEIKKRL